MRLLRQQLYFPPVQELVQRGEGILRDGTFVGVAPHLQAHQGHADVQGPVELAVKQSALPQKRGPVRVSQNLTFKQPKRLSILRVLAHNQVPFFPKMSRSLNTFVILPLVS